MRAIMNTHTDDETNRRTQFRYETKRGKVD